MESGRVVRYPDLWSRLIANTHEPDNDNSCWLWKGKTVCRFGYGRLDLWVPGLGGRIKISAHVATFVIASARSTSVNDFYLAYLELRRSGLELDHLCEEPSCIRVDHLEAVTRSENEMRKHERRLKRKLQQWM